MKKLILIALIGIVSVSAMAQSKPRKVTIKKSVTISKDSTYYLPDTIACVFKELIIKPDTVYERWQHGFVVWQTWELPTYYSSSSRWFSSGSISATTLPQIKEPAPYRNDYQFGAAVQGKFLYQNQRPVTNKVISVYKP